MENKKESRVFGKTRYSAAIFLGITAVVAIMGLVGYIPGLRRLGSVRLEYIPMAFSTAISFLIMASVFINHIFFSQRRASVIYATFVSVLVSIFGFFKFIEYFMYAGKSFEESWVMLADKLEDIPVGIMSPATGFVFFLAGIASLTLVLQFLKRHRSAILGDLSGALGFSVAAIGIAYMIGYAYEFPFLYDQGSVVPMALTTAVAFLFLGLGIISATGPSYAPLRFISGSLIRARLVRWFLLIALLPMLIFASVSFYHAKELLEHEEIDKILAIARDRAFIAEDHVSEKLRDARALAHASYIIDAMVGFNDVFKKKGADSEEYLAFEEKQKPFLSNFMREFAYHDLLLISNDGDVVFSVQRETDFGTNLETGPYKDTELAKTFKKAKMFLTDVVSDFRYYAPSDEPATFIAATLFDGEEFVGIIAFQLDNKYLYEHLQDYTGLGETGEIVLASREGNDVLFVGPLRHDPDAAFARRVAIGSKEGLPIQEAVQKKYGYGRSIDYRGKEIFAVWTYLPVSKLGMVVKIDVAEGFSGVISLRDWTLGISFMTVFIVLLISFYAARAISSPIQALRKGSEIIGAGNLDYRTGIDSPDEIGQLSVAFDEMTNNLKETTTSVEVLNKEILERKKVEEELNQLKEGLERKVTERTEELSRKVEELERYYSATTDRELRMKELREKIDSFEEGRDEEST